MIVYDGLKTDFLASCEKDSIAMEIEENILSKMGKHTPKAEFRSWENSLNYMYKVLIMSLQQDKHRLQKSSKPGQDNLAQKQAGF